jgi:hypothetical protein
MDRAGHPALLLADTVSSLACMDYRHDEWGVDVTVGASQKGLMLPPGLGFNAVSDKALAAAARAAMPRTTRQRPVKVAWPGPFSRKLRMPACWSSVPNSAANCTRSISSPVARSTPSPASMACLAARSASAGPLA